VRNTGRTFTAICIAICTFTAIVLATANITSYKLGQRYSSVGVSESSVSEYNSRYARLDEVYNRLIDQYYIEVDPETLIQGAIDGMMGSLNDPYTHYYTPAQMTSTNDEREGNYVGIGIQVIYLSTGEIYVTRVFKNGPAYAAGLREGDVITVSNGYAVSATNASELTEAVTHMKGPEGSITELTVKRGEAEYSFSVECQNVVSTRVDYSILDGNVGYIQLDQFFGDALEAMEDALAYMQENGAQALILDLRGNPGGALDICVNICDMFLPEGVVVYTENRAGDREYFYSTGEYYEIPLAVLINKNSASASEILAAAIQDYGRGTLIGQTTYGKGIVQTVYTFPVDGAGMQLTTSAYYTPNGRSIHGLGVTPDIVTEPDEVTEQTIIDGMTLSNDSTLRAAWELLTGKEYDAE